MFAQVDIDLFGSQHLTVLVVIAVVGLLFSFIARFSDSGARQVCLVLAIMLAVAYLFEQIYTIKKGIWTVHWLPLHLCDIVGLMSFVLMAAVVGRLGSGRRDAIPHARGAWSALAGPERRLQMFYELVYYWGLGGTLQALLTPDIAQAFPEPLFFTYFTAHGSIVIGVFVLTLGLRMRPRPGSAFTVWVITTTLGFVMLVVNGVLGTNFLFLCGPPPSATILKHFGAWPIPYLITIDAAAAAGITLCYAPFWLSDRLHRSRFA